MLYISMLVINIKSNIILNETYFAMMKFLVSTIIILFLQGFAICKAQISVPQYELAVSQSLYDSIVRLDSQFFDAYNKCEIDKMDSLISSDLEFYHDKGGFSNSKSKTMEAIKKNICGKVTRELLKGSIEVYEISGYGVVEIGFHGFHNNQEKEPGQTRFSKFIHIWKKNGRQWQLTRIVSLH